MQYIDSIIYSERNFKDGLLKILLGNALIFLLLSSTFERYEMENLFFHLMIEHLLFLVVGFLFGSGSDSIIRSFKSNQSIYGKNIIKFYSKYLAFNNLYNPFGLTTGLLFIFILFYWHFPSNFDQAIVNINMHLFMHVSIIFSGILLYSSFKMISRIQSLVFILSIDKIMGILGFFLADGDTMVYQTYPLSVQMTSGFFIISMMFIIDLICIMLILLTYFKSSNI